MGFWKNFINTFSMQGYKVYVTGESYALVAATTLELPSASSVY
jgi:hypothetical protein